MKILVTGAAGFIGSHLSEKLIARGDTVIGLDNFNDYYAVERKRKNVRHLLEQPTFTLVEDDMRQREAMLALFAAENFDAVAHLAGMAGVRNSIEHPAHYVNVNVNGTQNLFDGARYNAVGNFVMASTSSIYGDTTQVPFLESDPGAMPLQPYAASKRSAEILAYSYHHLYDFNFTATRFFTVYGSRNRPDMMASLLAESITTGKAIPYFQNGDMWRDWTHVNDITDGIVAALDRPLGYEILNLGRGEPSLLKDFVKLLEDLAQGKANLIHKPKPAGDMWRTWADISKAQTLIGYNPSVSLEDGVNDFWHWYRNDHDVA